MKKASVIRHKYVNKLTLFRFYYPFHETIFKKKNYKQNIISTNKSNIAIFITNALLVNNNCENIDLWYAFCNYYLQLVIDYLMGRWKP